MSNRRYFSKSQRDQIFFDSKGKCQKCGTKISYKGFQADHIIPHSKGGKTEIKNGQALCQKCNSSKSNKMQIENKNINPMKIEVPLSHQGFGAKNWSDTVERLGYGLIV